MVYTKKEVIQYINEEDVKFIRLAFCDSFGNQKNISIMPSELERAFENGIGIDASAVTGFGGEYTPIYSYFPTRQHLLFYRGGLTTAESSECSVILHIRAERLLRRTAGLFLKTQ